jgi:uncharacterized DUF497 family protein
MPDWSRYGFHWNEAIVEHIVDGHGVYPEEVEEVFANRPHVVRKGDLYHAYGRTENGSYLTVICAIGAGTIRVVTARPMDRSERRLYGRHRKNENP